MNEIQLQNDVINRPEPTGKPERSSATSVQETSRNQAEKSSSRKRIAAAIIALVLIGGLGLGFLPRWRQRQTATADMRQLAIPTVSVVSPTPGRPGNGLVLPAEIRPWREASIYARANGYLKDWVADIGAHVKPGQLLAEIETPDLDQQLAQAQAQFVLAEANLHLAQITDQRWQQLLKTASVSEQAAAEKAAARETAAASVEADRANMRRLQELVSFQRVVSPFAGTITLRNTDSGDLIIAGSGGKELFHIAQAEKLRVVRARAGTLRARRRTRPDGHLKNSSNSLAILRGQGDDDLRSDFSNVSDSFNRTRSRQFEESNSALQLWRGHFEGP